MFTLPVGFYAKGGPLGFDFSSPSGYETDYWDYQSQTVPGVYDNGVGTTTLTNNGGLPNTIVPGVLNKLGNPYNSWEADNKTDSIDCSTDVPGNFGADDFSLRFVYSLPAFAGQSVLMEKILFGGQPGWILFLEPTRTGFYINGSGGGNFNTAYANGAMADGNIHVTSVSYQSATKQLRIKSDLYPELLFVVSSPMADLSVASPLSVGNGNVADTSVGLNVIFAGICKGANYQAYYDEAVTLPP